MNAALKRRPRLLVLASTYPRWDGDPEPGFVHELAKRMSGQFEVTVLCPHAPSALTNEFMDGVRVHRFRYAPSPLETLVNHGGIATNLRRQVWKWLLVPGFVFGSTWSAWRTLIEERPDVIHAHWLLPQGLIIAVLGLFYRRMPPFLITSHGADLFALNGWPLLALKRFVARRAAGMTVVSSAMREEFTRIGGDVSKITIQPMGVDLQQRFTSDATERSCDEVLFVGRMVEKKGLRYLIDAMPEVLARRPGAFLTIAGFGPEEAERRAQVIALGLEEKVRFLGATRQSELPSLYRRAAVFVAPFVEADSGDREGLGLVAVEAAGCGCPVVVSDLPAVRQVFPDAAMARRVAPADPAALAGAIVDVLSEPEAARRQADALIARLLCQYDWQTVADGYAARLAACQLASDCAD